MPQLLLLYCFQIRCLSGCLGFPLNPCVSFTSPTHMVTVALLLKPSVPVTRRVFCCNCLYFTERYIIMKTVFAGVQTKILIQKGRCRNGYVNYTSEE